MGHTADQAPPGTAPDTVTDAPRGSDALTDPDSDGAARRFAPAQAGVMAPVDGLGVGVGVGEGVGVGVGVGAGVGAGVGVGEGAGAGAGGDAVGAVSVDPPSAKRHAK